MRYNIRDEILKGDPLCDQYAYRPVKSTTLADLALLYNEMAIKIFFVNIAEAFNKSVLYLWIKANLEEKHALAVLEKEYFHFSSSKS